MGSPFNDLCGVRYPIVQAPMAGSAFSELAIAVSNAGGLGSLACPLLDTDQIRAEVKAIREATDGKPFNLNFFAHRNPEVNEAAEAAWRKALDRYYVELGIAPSSSSSSKAGGRAPFDEERCSLVEELLPPIVSFHFGLPDASLVDRVKKTGAKIFSSATTVAEAKWLAEHGCDAIIAQGAEAGGHRGIFLSSPLNDGVVSQVGTFALLPQVVDAVRDVPVIAAGGIADARGVAAAIALGASAVQVGTAFLFTREARVSDAYRAALREASDDSTVITNVFTGRPARGIANRLTRDLGPMSEIAPEFPRAGQAVLPLRQASFDFFSAWAGQSAALARPYDGLSAAELIKILNNAD